MVLRLTLPFALTLLVFLTPSLRAQEEGSWNAPRVLELVDRARGARQDLVVDSAMRSYQADARGFVYFFIDRPDDEERTLVKADQIALEVFWRAPGDAKQRIVGLRDEKVLPTNIKYHLDHLTVVQDEFGDLIRLGDGDEVSAVLHPAAPGSRAVYDFRLADSLTLTFPGDRDPVRVFEVEVRPRDLDAPGFVGSLFLDRATAAIVRMNFTFTPSSYVDPYLDYIRISLDNGRWLDRFWLPYRQEVELRRELPQLDFLAGSIIRGRFEIGNYRFNEPLPDALFRTRGVSAVSEEQRRAFPFEEPLFSDLEAEGLAPSPALAEVERKVRQMVAGQALSGLRPTRLYVPSFSDAVRYNRAEGVFVGMGLAFRPAPGLALRGHGGWAFAREAASVRLEANGGDVRPGTGVAVYLDRLRDLGPLPGASGAVNTLAAVAGEDYSDPYFASGVALFHRFGPQRGRGLELAVMYEEHESAWLAAGSASAYRPIRPVDEGWIHALEFTLDLPDLPGGTGLEASSRLGRMGGRSFAAARAHLSWTRQEVFRALELSFHARAGAAQNDAPVQELYLLGGRGTIPGHAYRSHVGDRFWLVSGEVGHQLVAPWVEVHGFVTAGRAWMGDGRPLPPDWPGRGDGSARASVGVGVDLLWEVLRVDLARGLGRGGEWALVLEANSRFHPWL